MRLKRVHDSKRCLSPALNADSIPRKKFFVFFVTSAIEASSRRKTVTFTSSIPLESDKKNAHGQRRAISVRGTSFLSETGLGLWLKRKSFPHLRTEARSKRNRRVPIETRRGPIEARLRDRPRSEKAIPASAIRSTEQTKPGECWLKPGECRLKRLRDRPRSSAKEKAIPTCPIGSTEQTFSSECQSGNVPSCSVVTKAARTGCTPNKGHSLNDKAPVEKEGQNGGFSKALN